MKHFINILVLLLLAGLNISVYFMIEYTRLTSCGYGILWIPYVTILAIWIYKLSEDYE